MDTKDLKSQLQEIENGRFKDIVSALNISSSCGNCGYFNLSIEDEGQRYMCKVMPSCIAATLHPNLISYINRKIGWTDKDIECQK